MTRIAHWLAFCLVLLAGYPVPGRCDDVEILKVLEARRYDALIQGDIAAFADLMTDTFIYNYAGGGTTTKSALVEYMKTGEMKVKKVALENTQVRLYGDVAVVTGHLHADITQNGADGAQHTLYLHVWVRQGNTWRLDASQHTFLPEAKQ